MIRVLIADDSPTVRELLASVIGAEVDIRIVGQATNGREAVEMAGRLRPDLITMDINMPVLGGLEATREIMMVTPTPILIVTSQEVTAEVDLSLSATAAGALMIVPSLGTPMSPAFPARAATLVAMVRAMSQVKVVRRWQAIPKPLQRDAPRTSARPRPFRVVAIAASTGGPAALLRMLGALPRDFPLPILVVQHIAAEFVAGLAHWLGAECRIRVKVAESGEPYSPGTVYIAPDDYHLEIGPGFRVQLSRAPSVEGFRPSGSVLFESVAKAYGDTAAAVILTGMGRDGVNGLKAIAAAGGLVIAQDEATSVVNGMPGEAVAAGLADLVLPIDQIAPHLMREIER